MRAGVACVVPARLGSTRFPRKLLQPLLGKPVVVHTLERAAEAGCFAEIVCFTDSKEIGAIVMEHGFRYTHTAAAANGTERIGRSLSSLESDLVVNLQGDEPAFPVAGLRSLCAALEANSEWAHTLVHEDPPTAEEISNPNRVKVRLDANGFIRDFYRVVPPGRGNPRVAPTGGKLRLHLGAYGYATEFLRRYAALPPSAREIALSHEMLRDPELAPLRAHPSPSGAPVDVPEDLATARNRLNALRMATGVPA